MVISATRAQEFKLTRGFAILLIPEPVGVPVEHRDLVLELDLGPDVAARFHVRVSMGELEHCLAATSCRSIIGGVLKPSEPSITEGPKAERPYKGATPPSRVAGETSCG